MEKKMEISSEKQYSMDLEQEILVKVKTGNEEETKQALIDWYHCIITVGNHDMTFAKNRSVELCSILSRAALEGGAGVEKIFEINDGFLDAVKNADSLEKLYFQLKETVKKFSGCAFQCISKNNNGIIKQATQYISRNYSAHITLDDIADYVHLNATYFSTIFKRYTGISFKKYLNMVRIEESKRLLKNTNYSVSDVAAITGFDDTGYFSKVFKTYTGLTPKQYR